MRSPSIMYQKIFDLSVLVGCNYHITNYLKLRLKQVEKDLSSYIWKKYSSILHKVESICRKGNINIIIQIRPT